MVRTSLSIAFALALGSAAAVAAAPTTTTKPAPTAKPDPTKAAAPGHCPTPSKDACTSKSYLASNCLKYQADECGDFIEDDLKAFYEKKSAPELRMLRPNRTQIPADVRKGKYFPYSPKKSFKAVKQKLAATWAKKSKIAKVKKTGTWVNMQMVGGMALDLPDVMGVPPVDRVTKVMIDDAAKAHREPSWDANGGTIASCAEYGYEANYDITRFIDASAACRGDLECIYGVAYLGATPGIARRTLNDKDGNALESKITLAKGKFPKNDLFSAGASFLFANGTEGIPSTPDLEVLKGVLDKGRTHYSLDECDGAACDRVKKFDSEWDWHETLHDATDHLSPGELDEYERRRAEFRALLEQRSAAMQKERDQLLQREIRPVMPFDMVTFDPFERFEIEHKYSQPPTNDIKAIEKKFGKDVFNKSPKEVMKQVHGMRGGGSIAGVLAAPTATKPKAGTTTPKKTSKAGDAKMNPCIRLDGWGWETLGHGPISCKIGKFLRDEWARKKAGQKSCLDPNNKECDWAPSMFEARMVLPVPLLDKQLADENYCKAWSDGTTLPKNSVSDLRKQLVANEVAFGEAWKKVKAYDEGHGPGGKRLGKTWPKSEYLGDKDWFAAGYSTEVGWHVASLQKQGDQDLVCEVGGEVKARANFQAWIAGADVDVVSGSVHARANHERDHKVTYKARLEVLDQSVFTSDNYSSDPEKGWTTAQAFSPDPQSGMGISLPKPKPRFDIYVGVPISGELWGELLHGEHLQIGGKASSGCDPANPKFGIGATFTPFFGAYGMGQVGIGVSGVVSAGVRAALALITLGVPVSVDMKTRTKDGSQMLSFQSELSMLLGTLSGRVSLYIEFLMFEEEWELFRWNGIGPAKIPLMPKLVADVPLAGMK